MKTDKGSWPSLDKLPPSIVFQPFDDFINDGVEGSEAQRSVLTRMIESVEGMVRLDLRIFIDPPPNSKPGSLADVKRMVVDVSGFISMVEDGLLEYDLRRINATDLLVRYLDAHTDALEKAKALRAFLAAAVDNAIGRVRNETLEQRLKRSIKAASEAAPVFLGSFEQHADVPEADE